MPGVKKTVLVSEVGWRGIRELSIYFDKNSVPCEVLIKGEVPEEILGIITPHKNIKILPVNRFFFNVVLLSKIIAMAPLSRVALLIFSKEQTRQRFRFFTKLFSMRTFLLIETKDGYDLYGNNKEEAQVMGSLINT